MTRAPPACGPRRAARKRRARARSSSLISHGVPAADVNIGILATHGWRGDLQFTLQSPTGTRVQLTNGDTQSISGDNFNVLLDDAATQLVNTDGANRNHSTSAPPYQNTYQPRSLLSAFDGETSAGTWRLEICDLYPAADNGQFVRADLYLRSAPANYAVLAPPVRLTASLFEVTPGGKHVGPAR